MKRNTYLGLIITLTIFLIVGGVISAYATPSGATTRLYGSDRFDTAVAISQAGWSTSEYVIISTGEGIDTYADALAGAPLTKLYNAPMLLTNIQSINDVILNEIKRLGANKAVILGGTSVVSANAEQQLRDMGMSVERLCGLDRYATAEAIAKKLKTQASFHKAILTTGYEFQYALMAAPFTSNTPVLFSPKDYLTAGTKQALIDMGIKEIDIIGGPNIISQDVMDDIVSMGITVRRIGGNSIEEVNIELIKNYNKAPSKMALARNDLFADALSGSAFALKNQTPIFLIGSNYVTTELKTFILGLNTTENYIFGGTVAISDGVIGEIIPPNNSANPPDNSTNPPADQHSGLKFPHVKLTDLNSQFLGSKKSNNINILGNASGNIVNYGIAAAQGEWVYFALTTGLFKAKADGSDTAELYDSNCFFVNVVGDYLYFADSKDSGHLYKMKTDGTLRQKILDRRVIYVTVLGEWIYYWDYIDSKAYKIKTDGTGKTVVVNDTTSYMNISGNWIYYYKNDGSQVCRIGLDGTNNQVLFTKEIGLMNVQGDWLYYTDKTTRFIYKVNISSPTPATIIKSSATTCINVSGDWVYYIYAADKNIYKMKTDGTGTVRLNNKPSVFINVVGDLIFYYESNGILHIMNSDGSDDYTLVEP